LKKIYSVKRPIVYKKIYFNDIFIKLLRAITPIILFFLKVRIKKVEGTIPKNGPLLIAAHHEHLADQFIIGLPIKRRLFWIADITPPGSKKSFADQPLKKWFLVRVGAIPIDKKNPQRNIHLFDHVTAILQMGEAVVIFPEAYLRSERNYKRLGKAKDGVIRLAQYASKKLHKKIPIYPIGLEYRKKDAYVKIGSAYFADNSKHQIKKLMKKIAYLSNIKWQE
jgi:1-acyl-sn-glycerol-3-phosphate acyltransferase